MYYLWRRYRYSSLYIFSVTIMNLTVTFIVTFNILSKEDKKKRKNVLKKEKGTSRNKKDKMKKRRGKKKDKKKKKERWTKVCI